MARRLVAGMLALAAAAAMAPAARAHTVLVRSEPADGASLARAPGTIRLAFSEAISPSFASAQVLDGRGAKLPVTVRADGDRRLVLQVPALRTGAYQVLWEVLGEEDGHVSGGALAFGVGAAPPARAAGPHAAGEAGSPVESLLRWVDFALLSCLVGGLAVGTLLARAAPARAAGEARRRLLAGAAWSAVAAAALGGVLLVRQLDALLATLPPGRSLPDAASQVLGTRWGVLWLGRELLLIALALTLAWLPRRGRFALRGAWVLAVAVVAARAAGGHAATVDPRALAIAADAVHVLAAAVWLGGVLALALALSIVHRQRADARALMRSFRRPFGWMAATSVVALAVTGLFSAGAQVASVDALLETFYGRTLIAKAALVLVAGGLGVANACAFGVARRNALGGDRGRRARGVPRLLVVEAFVGLEVLAAAAVLTASTPARGPEFAAPRPAPAPTLVQQVDDLLVTATTRPNRPGANVVTVLAVSSRRPPAAPVDGVRLRVRPLTGKAAPGSSTEAATAAPAGSTEAATAAPAGSTEAATAAPAASTDAATAAPGSVALRRIAPGRFAGAAQISAAGRWQMAVLVRRAGRTLSAPLTWSVAPPARTRPVVVSSRRLAPLLDRAALLLLVAVAALALAGGAAAVLRSRPLVGKEAA